MTVNQRIRQARQALKMNQVEFARKIYISSGYIAELECEHRKANDRIIHLIALTFGISEKWLKDGEGEMFYQTPPEKIRRMMTLYHELPPRFQDYALEQLEGLVKTTKND